jgi:hypothetical protein
VPQAASQRLPREKGTRSFCFCFVLLFVWAFMCMLVWAFMCLLVWAFMCVLVKKQRTCSHT